MHVSWLVDFVRFLCETGYCKDMVYLSMFRQFSTITDIMLVT